MSRAPRACSTGPSFGGDRTRGGSHRSGSDEPDFEALEPHVAEVLEELLPREDLPLVNVNLPAEPKGTRWTRQAVNRYDGKIVADRDPYGRDIYWFVVEPIEQVDPGTDLWAMREGYVSMTPLELDLSDHEALERMGVEGATAVESAR